MSVSVEPECTSALQTSESNGEKDAKSCADLIALQPDLPGLSAEDSEMLTELDLRFSKRYSNEDTDYVASQAIIQPPCVHPWANKQKRAYDWANDNRGRGRHGHNNRGYNNDRGRGSGRGYRGGDRRHQEYDQRRRRDNYDHDRRQENRGYDRDRTDNRELRHRELHIRLMTEVNLSKVLGYVLDHTDLPMKDCASLQLVSRSMNVVVCSQFYPHVQSVARLGLTDRVVARALKSPEIFFRKFPVMNDLHVPWNPHIIDASAAIPITDACQLLADYPQIRSLPPMYLEREGLEGLCGHSLRSVTVYPGRYDDDQPSTEPFNLTAAKLQVEQLEIVSNRELRHDEYKKMAAVNLVVPFGITRRE